MNNLGVNFENYAILHHLFLRLLQGNPVKKITFYTYRYRKIFIFTSWHNFFISLPITIYSSDFNLKIYL